ncbi:universal stress protein [Pedobacter sp. G11]|uniref:universal stress protein n=1 Tax=Pedobacter sp. G11 TaxID=2482728 RepID=UPI000F5EC7A9|nr:universal stress protein [Pedobacter sp. G11]AZI26739.1 universal stress protein [Pedobacter sp. G11]
MKKILVPTDFSAPAESAAKYAISMAKVLDARLTIVNAFILPVTVSESGLWPVIDTAELEGIIGGELDRMVNKLLDDSCSDEPANCPMVNYRCAEGPVLAVIEQISGQIDPDLVVMGLSGAGGLVNFILGSNSMAIIEKGDRPVLLIPFGARYHGIKKIVYVGSLTPQDIKPLVYLCKLASWFKSEVCVLHIIEMRKDLNSGMQAIGEDFIGQMRILTGYNKIRYEPVWNNDIDQGLEWIAEQEDIDIVSMLHRKHNILDKIFSGSRTKRFARYTTTPLLVFPPDYIEKKA